MPFTKLRKLSSEAVARPSVGNLDVVATASDKDQQDNIIPDNNVPVNVHVATLPSQQSDDSSSGRKGLGGVTPASQGKTSLWSSKETEELKRLVSSNTGPKGNISWVAVEATWRGLNLPSRTKASLSSKRTSIKLKTNA